MSPEEFEIKYNEYKKKALDKERFRFSADVDAIRKDPSALPIQKALYEERIKRKHAEVISKEILKSFFINDLKH